MISAAYLLRDFAGDHQEADNAHGREEHREHDGAADPNLEGHGVPLEGESLAHCAQKASP
jgi:hypothetical protein